MPNALALYTTIYPGALSYLKEWIDSIQSQTDSSFTLWIGVDNLKTECVAIAEALNHPVRWVHSQPGENPVDLRCRALLNLADEHDAVVLVDCDDMIEPDRVGAAKEQLCDCLLYTSPSPRD